jgi:hypothetical protein
MEIIRVVSSPRELYFKEDNVGLASSKSGLISTACASSVFALAASPRPRYPRPIM